MNFLDYLKLECCEINFKAKNKEECLKKIARLMKKSEALNKIPEETIFHALLEREKTGSTGFANGIAIPHSQVEGLDDFVIGLAVAKKGIDFKALDKKKSKIFVVILGPKGEQASHLKLLATISNVLKDSSTRDILIKSDTKINLYENFIRKSTVEEIDFSTAGKDKLMLMIVDNEEIIQDITEIFLEYDINQSTMIESKQMENIMSDIPLFMGFFDFTGEKNLYTQMLVTKIKEGKVQAVIKGLEEVLGDLKNYKGLAIYVLDLAYSIGSL